MVLCSISTDMKKDRFFGRFLLNERLNNVREIEQSNGILPGNQGGWEDEFSSLAKVLVSWVYGDVCLLLTSFFVF